MAMYTGISCWCDGLPTMTARPRRDKPRPAPGTGAGGPWRPTVLFLVGAWRHAYLSFAILAGLGGAVVADLADRNNPPITQALMLMMLSASLAPLAASSDQPLLTAFSALVFGLAYMSLTGLYLMTGIRLLPGRLSVGPVLPFMAVSLGQATGSPAVGRLVEGFGYADAFAMFAALGILVAILSPFYPGAIAQAEEEEAAEEESGLQAAYDSQLLDEEGEPLEDPLEEEEEQQPAASS